MQPESTISKSFLREPFLSTSHLFGAILGIAATSMLLCSCASDSQKFFVLFLYGLTLIFLFSASALYHGIHHRCDARETFFEKLDYAGIYIFIAGTYTPLSLYALRPSIGIYVLLVQWIAALAGSYSVLRWGFAKKPFQVTIFLIMGWSFIFVGNSLYASLSDYAIFYLLLGAMAYSVGALIFLFAPKRIFSERICTHAIWHVFVLIGAYSHFFMVKHILNL